MIPADIKRKLKKRLKVYLFTISILATPKRFEMRSFLFLLISSLITFSSFAQKDVPPLEIRRVVIDLEEGDLIGSDKKSDRGEKIDIGSSKLFYNKYFKNSSNFYESSLKTLFQEAFVERGYNILNYHNIFEELRKPASPRYAIAFKIDSILFNYSTNGSAHRQFNLFHSYIGIRSLIIDLSTDKLVHNQYKIHEFYTEKEGYNVLHRPIDLSNYFYQAIKEIVADLSSSQDFRSLIEESKTQWSSTISGDTLIIDVQRKPNNKESEIQNAINSTVTLRNGSSGGSGAVISNEGHILTCEHTLYASDTVDVILSNEMKMKAAVIRRNKEYDVALLKLITIKSNPILINNSDMPVPATEAYVIGTPADETLGQTITKGVISGNRTIEDKQYIQTDASVSPGNSGGPLLNENGELVGIINAKIVGGGTEGLGFAIPISVALNKLNIILE